MAHTTVAADLGQALDVKRGLTAEIAFHDAVAVNGLTERVSAMISFAVFLPMP